MKIILDSSLRKKSKHVFYFQEYTFWNFVSFIRYVEKYCRGAQAAYDNMAHAHCILET
jgi:hypothetical protein